MTNIVNLTPHTINLCGKEITSTGLARCESVVETAGDINGVKINRRTFGAVYGLPEPQADTIYIVSAIVAQAVAGQRDDLYIVDETIRDEAGRIIGCNALAKVGNAKPEYQAFKKAVKEQLNSDNIYVRKFMPEVGKFTEAERDEDGGLIIWHGHITEEQALQEGIESLLDDKSGYFEEMVNMSELSEVVIPLMRSLIKEALNG